MKVLFAIKALSGVVGGAERVFSTICSELAIRGHDIYVVTFDRPGLETFYTLDAKVKKIDLGIGDSVEATGLVDFVRRMVALRRLVSKLQPDIIVGFMHSMFVPMAFALIGKNVPVVGSEHIVPEFYANRRVQYLLMQLAAPHLSKLTVLSESIRQRYNNRISERMEVMPNPIKLGEKTASIGLNRERYTLLSIGRLTEQKDHSTLIKAFALVAQDFPQWHLRIIGEGVLRYDLEVLISSLSLHGRVSLPGVTSEIGLEYESAELFVIASRYEAFGLVTAEAMSYGLPVIGFADCPGTNELIQPERTGLLITPLANRAASLSFGLSRLMKNPTLRKSMGSAGREEVTKHYSPEQVCDRWETLLETMVEHN